MVRRWAAAASGIFDILLGEQWEKCQTQHPLTADVPFACCATCSSCHIIIITKALKYGQNMASAPFECALPILSEIKFVLAYSNRVLV